MSKNITQQIQATVTFPIEAGFLVRGQIRGAVEGFCFAHDLECKVYEAKGFLNSVYYFKITGPESDIKMMIEWLKAIERQNG